MEIDYRSMTDLVIIRQKQIEDVALERVYFNTEYMALEEIKQQLAKLLILERRPADMFAKISCVGKATTAKERGELDELEDQAV